MVWHSNPNMPVSKKRHVKEKIGDYAINSDTDNNSIVPLLEIENQEKTGNG